MQEQQDAYTAIRTALGGRGLAEFTTAGELAALMAALPFQAYERAVYELDHGGLGAVIDAEVELLTWMAGTLTPDPDPGPDYDAYGVPAWIEDTDLREQLGVEAERLRQCAARGWARCGPGSPR